MNQFQKMLDAVIPYKNELQPYYKVESNKFYLHLRCFWALWSGDDAEIPTRYELLEEIRELPYYLADNVLTRVDDTPMRLLLLSLNEEDSPPKILSLYADAGYDCFAEDREAFNASFEAASLE